MFKEKNKLYIIFTIVFFCVIYSLISLVNHYNFRTYTLDLGAYTNALFDYSNLQWNDSTTFKPLKENLLADHFDLYLILFAPLSFIFKTYTLLVIQILSILIGGIGVFKYFSYSNKKTGLFALIYFYTFFGVFSAISFDYHSNVIAACAVPWLLYFISKKRLFFAALILVFIVIGKENMSLWTAFICFGLIYEYKKEKSIRLFLIFSALFCITYFFIITSVVMPSLSNQNVFPHFKYAYLGSDYLEALLHLVQHPLDSFKTLFTNHTNSQLGDYIKLELHVLLFLSGLPILLFKPQYFLMLIPIYFQKLYHNDISMWGTSGQYCIEFTPILAIGIFSFLDMFNRKYCYIISSFVLIFTISSSVRTMDNSHTFNRKENLRFYQSIHYTNDFSVEKLHYELLKIPKNSIVSAQSFILPHLALRNNIYQFPIIKNASLIVYTKTNKTYPMEEEDFIKLTNNLEKSDEWKTILNQDKLVILERKAVESKE